MNFTEEQVEAFREHREYHKNMIEYLNKVEEGAICLEPKRPRSRLDFIKPNKKTIDKACEEIELNTFLLRNLCEITYDNDLTIDEHNSFYSIISFEVMKTKLKDGCSRLNSFKRRTLSNSLILGNWLKHAQEWFKTEKRKLTWKEFLIKEIEISYSYANKLIEISSLFFVYSKFHRLSLSVEELYTKRKLIVKYFRESVAFRNVWQSE